MDHYQLELGPHELSLNELKSSLLNPSKISISDEAKQLIKRCRTYIDDKIKNSDESFYGINTGFGSLYNINIDKTQIEKLQENLIVSHACGMGDEVSTEIVQLILLLKVKNFCYGNSGVSLELVERLIYFYNEGIYPQVFELGSLGASGDLAPLAHVAIALIGKGKAYYKNELREVSDIYDELNLKPLTLQSKEGLALINGTQFSTAFACWTLIESDFLIQNANYTAAISLDAYDCHLGPFDPLSHAIRPHSGQIKAAEMIHDLLKDSSIAIGEKEHVQDPYSFRCIPQVVGACLDAIEYAKKATHTEINSVTDNPLIFPEQDQIISAGNFHAQPVAFALDLLAMALAEIGSISERRIYKLLHGHRNLPPFLIKDAGLNSGLMITQYTAASIVSQNKQLCTPASVDSISSSAGQEDHVSMAANAGTKAMRVLKNVKRIIAIELLVGAQALEFRRPSLSSEKIESFIKKFRSKVSFNQSDRYLREDMIKTFDFLENQNKGL